ncbi:MAG: hypothetical protein SNF33_02930 [Candidatus Algichlamydia australiensis]|nr:hypothetical protein [Chlamydiales bacterium]
MASAALKSIGDANNHAIKLFTENPKGTTILVVGIGLTFFAGFVLGRWTAKPDPKEIADAVTKNLSDEKEDASLVSRLATKVINAVASIPGLGGLAKTKEGDKTEDPVKKAEEELAAAEQARADLAEDASEEEVKAADDRIVSAEARLANEKEKADEANKPKEDDAA